MLLACVNVAAQWGHAWSLRFSCTVRTCRSRSMGLTKVLSQRGQACAPLLALPTGEFESKVLGDDRVWVVEWLVRTCVTS